MYQKRFGIAALVMTVLMFVFGVIENVVLEMDMFSVITPLLFIATLICGYFAFKDDVSFASKWAWLFIAIFFTFSLTNVADLLRMAFDGNYSIMYWIAGVLSAAGVIIIFMSVFNRMFFRLMPVGFGLLALERLVVIVITRYAFNISNVFVIILLATLTIMALNCLPELNKLFRFVAVLLAVICFKTLGIYMAVAFVVLAFLLVPGVERIKFNVAILVSLLCLITALATPVVNLKNEPFGDLEYISDQISSLKDEIKSYKTVKEYEKDIEDNKNLINQKNTEKTNLANEKEGAEKALDAVCSSSYYSPYWGNCDDVCRPLHENVEEIEAKIEICFDKIETLEDENIKIEDKIERINEIKKTLLPELYTKSVDVIISAIMNIIAMLLVAAALVLLAVCILKANYGKLALLSCAVMGVGSLIYMLLFTYSEAFWNFDILNYPVLKFIGNPYLWSMVIFAMFAVIFTKPNLKLVKFRIFAIIAAVIMVILSVFADVTAPSSLFVFYAITMISVSFVLVPSVFTEYNNVGKHIFFTIITLGIWQLIWIYNVTKNLNKVKTADSRKPVIELVLCVFLPFYFVHWVFKTAEIVELYGAENGKQIKISIPCLAFMFVCRIISTVIIQDKINSIVGKPE